MSEEKKSKFESDSVSKGEDSLLQVGQSPVSAETKPSQGETTEKRRRSNFFRKRWGSEADSENAAACAGCDSVSEQTAARREMSAVRETARRPAAFRQWISAESKTKKYCAAALGVLLLGAAVYGSVTGIDYLLHGKKAYAITVDNRQVATVSDYRTAREVIHDYLSGAHTETDIKDAYFTEEVDINKVYESEGQEILSYREASSRLAASATALADCVAIEADGDRLLYLSSEADAEEALARLKEQYTPHDSTLRVRDVRFKEEVRVVPANADVQDILSVETAVRQLRQTSTDSAYVYTVREGDTLHSICEQEGVAASKVEKVSGETDLEALRPGDRLRVVKEGEFPLNVLVEMEKTKDEIISYEISYQENDEMPAGTQNVVQEGFDGSETVQLKILHMNGEELYRERLSAVTDIPATTKIVDCGTKVYRGNGGNLSGMLGEDGRLDITSVDQMIWPTNATAISSPYGPRSSGFHTGLDINGELGDPIWAALSGTVVSAGWSGNYGNCIVVNHGNGVSTRYAHLSVIGVSAGQAVSQGQTIGLEGSTGNSTGSHLHFEVLINGSSVDPLLYISR